MAPKTQRRLVLALMGVCAVLAVAIVCVTLHKAGIVTVAEPLVRDLQEHAAVKEYWRLYANDPKSIEVVEWMPTYDAHECDLGKPTMSGVWRWSKAEAPGRIIRVRYRERRMGSMVICEGVYLYRDGAVVDDMSGLGVRLRSEGQLGFTANQHGLDTERPDQGAVNFLRGAMRGAR